MAGYTFTDQRFTSSKDVLKDGAAKPTKSIEMVGTGGGVANWKEMNFFMGSSKGTATSGRENDWRHITSKDGSIDFKSNPVNKNVLLIPEMDSLEVRGGISVAQFNESADEGKSKILDLLKEGVEMFTGTKAVPEWNATVFSDLKQLELGGPLEFKFHYGSAGLYSGYEEVIKPIIALTLFFGVEAGDGTIDGHLNAAVTNIASPYPTKAQFLMEKVKSAGTTLKSAASDIASGSLDGASLASAMSKANTMIQSVIAGGAAEVALSSAYRNVYLQWGRLTLGPMVYEGYGYSLNMKDLDDNGWPISGSFKVEGLKSMRKSSTQAMLSPFIKGA